MRLEKIAVPPDEPAGTRTETCPIEAVPADWRAHWDALAAEASECNVFAERWFVEPGARHLLPPGETRLIAVWSGGGSARTLLGLLPVRVEGRYGRSPVRHVQNWVHYQSFLGTPLVRAGEERAFWSAVLAALDAAEWAPGFFHMVGLAEDGPAHRALAEAAAQLGRPCHTVHRSERALLEAGLSPSAYYEAAIRKKKRKELARLSARLAELGTLAFETLDSPRDVQLWCNDFLALEAAGWKGDAGSALASCPATEAFFRDVFAAAFACGRLEALRMALDGRTIAMLVNFIAPPGAFSYKIAFDEAFARFSPGVLIEIENLRILARGDVRWMDSCASENHPMINSLWRERRSVVRVSVPLAGARRAATFRICRALEDGSALVRRLRRNRNG